MSKQIFQKFDVEFRKKVIVPTPEGDDEAVNKAYADSLVSGDNSFRIPSSDIISGANIHFFDTLKVSCLDIQSNKFAFPTPETFYNKICVSILGEEYGYTGGVMSLENVSESNKNSLENRLNQGFCVAIAIYNADTDIFTGTGTRSPKNIYDEQVANPELKYIRIGSFFKNGNDYFLDVNPGIF